MIIVMCYVSCAKVRIKQEKTNIFCTPGPFFKIGADVKGLQSIGME
jgi:hypothetical protein